MTKTKKLTLKELILHKRMLICLLNGFTAGLPIYFLSQLIPAWLREEGVDLKTIGFFGFIMVPYSFKYLWAPLLDKYIPPFLGRRRGWMMITQIALLLFMSSLALLNPTVNIDLILYAGLAIAFFSATQDIVLDAYRRELLPDKELGLGNAYYANAYRVAGFIPGGLGLILADFTPWPLVFVIISCFMGVGVFQTLWIKELDDDVVAPTSLKEAVIDPFKEFFIRDGFKSGILILSFIFFYKFGDVVATSLLTPFYLDVGFSKTVIGTIAKTVGVASMIVGGTLGGLLMFKMGINKSLWIFGVIQMLSILGFAVLNEVGPNEAVFSAVVAFEYLGVGLGSAALMAYIAKNTNKNFSGTQLALLSSFFAIPKSFSGIIGGVIIEGISTTDETMYKYFGEVAGLGYTNFYYICTLLAVPGMLLLFWVAPWNEKKENTHV
jgi:PAT family beta-lactamase induction signal transducer AmpG